VLQAGVVGERPLPHVLQHLRVESEGARRLGIGARGKGRRGRQAQSRQEDPGEVPTTD
jgi:hypothetical protein